MFKRFILFAVAALAVMSCGAGAKSPKLISTATYQKMSFQPYVTPVQVDLKVSPKKINYFMLVSETVRMGGFDNVVATAVKEALEANGGDVIVGLQTQTKYNDDGEIESINISGFPANYVNFRSNETLPIAQPKEESAGLAPSIYTMAMDLRFRSRPEVEG